LRAWHTTGAPLRTSRIDCAQSLPLEQTKSKKFLLQKRLLVARAANVRRAEIRNVSPFTRLRAPANAYLRLVFACEDNTH
jgi:hypothetical protein